MRCLLLGLVLLAGCTEDSACEAGPEAAQLGSDALLPIDAFDVRISLEGALTSEDGVEVSGKSALQREDGGRVLSEPLSINLGDDRVCDYRGRLTLSIHDDEGNTFEEYPPMSFIVSDAAPESVLEAWAGWAVVVNWTEWALQSG